MFSIFSSPSPYQQQALTPFAKPTQRHPQQLFTPQTPSPLRTSYCANRMSGGAREPYQKQQQQQHIPSSPLATYTAWSDVGENNENVNIFSPLEAKSINTHHQLQTPSTASTTQTFNAFTPSTTTSTVFSSAPTTSQRFAFEQRSRGSSPGAQLSNHSTSSREKQKRKFLDRIRARREEESDLRFGDSLLRMDWVEERRQWEREMGTADDGVMEDEDMEGDMDAEAREMSPTEEREVEELLELLHDRQQQEEQEKAQGWRMSRANDDTIDEEDNMFDEEHDWDNVFADFVEGQDGMDMT